jgi:hypothetical protein
MADKLEDNVLRNVLDPEIKAAAPSVLTDKVSKKNWSKNFLLHVMLIEHHNGLSKSEAQVQAYFEGFDGLKKRLG